MRLRTELTKEAFEALTHKLPTMDTGASPGSAYLIRETGSTMTYAYESGSSYALVTLTLASPFWPVPRPSELGVRITATTGLAESEEDPFHLAPPIVTTMRYKKFLAEIFDESE